MMTTAGAMDGKNGVKLASNSDLGNGFWEWDKMRDPLLLIDIRIDWHGMAFWSLSSGRVMYHLLVNQDIHTT